ncbi:hypothetical protein QR64_22060 [Rhodococcus sp. Chr-9]|nr:hypothetical protein QR64_22060 [Rhodococcus sp. Chr-9]
MRSDRWVEISPSPFDHEREGLERIKDHAGDFRRLQEHPRYDQIVAALGLYLPAACRIRAVPRRHSGR